jgi:hypothetical protein
MFLTGEKEGEMEGRRRGRWRGEGEGDGGRRRQSTAAVDPR